MTDGSVSWIGLGLSALLIIDKLVSRSKRMKCKCCGACFEMESTLSTSPQPHRRKSKQHELEDIKIENHKLNQNDMHVPQNESQKHGHENGSSTQI